MNDIEVILNCHLFEYHISYVGHFKINLVLNIVLQSIVAVAIITLNIAVLFSILKDNRKLSPQMVLIIHNTVADILLGVFLITLYTPLLIFASLGRKVCGLFIASLKANYFIGAISFLNVVFISTDLYMAIIKPFFYRAKILDHSKVYVKLIVTLWIVTALVLCARVFWPQEMGDYKIVMLK